MPKTQTTQLKMGNNLNIHLSKEEIQMANKYKKKCLISLVFEKCKSKPQGDTIWHPLGWLWFKKKNRQQQVMMRIWRKLEPSHTAGRNMKWYSCFGKLKFLRQLNAELSYDPASRYIHKRNENICPHKYESINYRSRTIHNDQKMETTQMSNRWMDKQTGIFCVTIIIILAACMWKFPGQGLNLCHSSDNARSFMH